MSVWVDRLTNLRCESHLSNPDAQRTTGIEIVGRAFFGIKSEPAVKKNFGAIQLTSPFCVVVVELGVLRRIHQPVRWLMHPAFFVL